MASITINGDTSGGITIASPSVAGTNTLTLPAATGTLITESMTLLGTLTTTSGTTHTLSGLNLTQYKELFISFTNVSGNSGSTTPATANALQLDGIQLVSATANNYLMHGTAYLNLLTGTFIAGSWNAASANDSRSCVSTTAPVGLHYGKTSYSTETTSLVFSLVSASFDSGSIVVYGVK